MARTGGSFIGEINDLRAAKRALKLRADLLEAALTRILATPHANTTGNRYAERADAYRDAKELLARLNKES